MNNSSNITVLAFLAGAAAGGITALLLAPTSGKDLRERIGAGAGTAGSEAARLVSNARVAAVDGYRKSVRRAEEAVEDAKAQVVASKQAVVDAVVENEVSREPKRAVASSN